MRLSPVDPSLYTMLGATAYAHFLAGRYEAASLYAERAMRINPNVPLTICVFAASTALAGQLEQAQRGVGRALELNPNLRASNLKNLTPFRRTEDLATFTGALRKAGLPD
jgi:Flp pilus assembly protein TadD